MAIHDWASALSIEIAAEASITINDVIAFSIEEKSTWIIFHIFEIIAVFICILKIYKNFRAPIFCLIYTLSKRIHSQSRSNDKQ